MRSALLILFAGIVVPLYGQQPFCFSRNCVETPATTFRLDRSDKDLSGIFVGPKSQPPYVPIAPLALSPSTQQFFQSVPSINTGHGLVPAKPGNSVATVAGAPGTIRTPAATNGSHVPGCFQLGMED